MASIQKRTGPLGDSWRVRFRIDGVERSETFYEERGAAQFMKMCERIGTKAAVAVRDAHSEPGAASMTVTDMARRHVENLSGITDGTRKTYMSYVNRDIAPSAIGEMPISAVSRDQAGQWADELAKRLSGKSVRNRHALLSATMSRAVNEGLRPNNPCQGIRLAKTERREMAILTEGEFAVLLSAIDLRYQSFVLTLVGTGLRWGEATALQVGDLDLDADIPTLRVSRAWKMTGSHKRELGPPKTSKGRRVIGLPSEVAAVLRPLTDGRSSNDFLFVNPGGGPLRSDRFHTRVWGPAMDRLNATSDVNGDPIKAALAKRPRIHDLRHTHASWLIAEGVPLPVIQRRLGHESITTTVDTYGGLMPDYLEIGAHATSRRLTQAVPELIRGISTVNARLAPGRKPSVHGSLAGHGGTLVA
jgi:integrase